MIVATHEAAGSELGTAILLVTVALFVAMIVVFLMLRRETRQRRQRPPG